MKLVNLYHVAGVGMLVLMAVSFSLGFKESAMVLGVGIVVVLVLGVFLVLDNLGNQLNYHETRIAEISNNVESVKASVEIIGKLVEQDMVYSAQTLDEIRRDISKIEDALKETKSNA